MNDPKLNNLGNSLGRISEQLVSDLAEFLPPHWREKSQRSLNFALDLLRPQARALGLRVARLTKEKVELVLPLKARNESERGEMLEGSVVLAGVEAYKWLWNQNQGSSAFEIRFSETHLQIRQPLVSDLRFRIELQELNREKVLFHLAQHQAAEDEAHVLIFDQNEQLAAELRLVARFTQRAALTWA